MFPRQVASSKKREDSPEEQPQAAEEMTTKEEHIGTIHRTAVSRPRHRGHGEVLRSHARYFQVIDQGGIGALRLFWGGNPLRQHTQGKISACTHELTLINY